MVLRLRSRLGDDLRGDLRKPLRDDLTRDLIPLMRVELRLLLLSDLRTDLRTPLVNDLMRELREMVSEMVNEKLPQPGKMSNPLDPDFQNGIITQNELQHNIGKQMSQELAIKLIPIWNEINSLRNVVNNLKRRA